MKNASTEDEWTTSLKVNDTFINFKLNIGAQTCIAPEILPQMLRKRQVKHKAHNKEFTSTKETCELNISLN